MFSLKRTLLVLSVVALSATAVQLAAQDQQQQRPRRQRQQGENAQPGQQGPRRQRPDGQPGDQQRPRSQRGQRPRSFAMPTFVFGENGFQLAIGSSGGDRIPQTVFQVLCRYFNGEDLQSACDKPRINMEGFFYRVEDEKYIDPYGKLEKNGFGKLVYSSKEFFGALNAVGVKDGQLFGASDMRRSGKFEVSGTEDPGQN